MLESCLVESCSAHRTKKPWTVSASITLHVVALTALLLMPLIYTSALPSIDLSSRLVPPAMKKVVIDLVPATERPRIIKVPEVDARDLIAPTAIPREIATIVDPPSSPTGFSSAPTGSPISSIFRSILPAETVPALPSPSLPPEPVVPVQTEPIRVSAGVQQANLIRQVKPEYPPLARQARIQGVVVLEAMISKDGGVDNLRVISGHPLLVKAAIDAVSQWKYRPTLLSGEPIEVITTITVTFSFSN